MTHHILDTEKNIPVDFDVFLEDIQNRDIIYIGEFHQVQEILAFQIDIISGLLQRGFHPSIGLEMFNVLQQEILDYYTEGVITFEQLMNLYDMGPEGFDLKHYRNIIDIALKNKLKAICLNIPRDIASSVARHGLDRKELDGLYLNEQDIKNCSDAYKKAIGSVYKKHPHEEITEENFILSQSIKDEMMAETIVHYLKTGNVRTPLIVITGRGHIEHWLGIPERVKGKMVRRGVCPSDVLIVAVHEDEYFVQNIADYIVFV